MAYKKVSEEEIIILERIFMLQISIDLLKQGRRPFHKEAIGILKKEIKKLGNYVFNDTHKMKNTLANLGYRDFFTLEKIINKVRSSKYLSIEETIKDGNGFIFFTNKKQHLWIIVSSKHLFVILDDVTSDKTILKLRTNLENLKVDYIQLETGDNNYYGRIKFPNIEEKFWCSLSLFQTNEDIIRHINLLKTIG